MINNLPITNMPNDKDTVNIDLALCNWDQTDIRLCDEMLSNRTTVAAKAKLKDMQVL